MVGSLRRSLPLAAFAAALLAPGCARHAVHFDGRAEDALARAEDIRELEDLPEGFESIGRVVARCTLVEGKRPRRGARLSDVDCTESRLLAALAERAAEVGGELMIGRRCRSRLLHEDERSHELAITCEAEVARPDDDALSRRPLAAGRPSSDATQPRAVEAWAIRVHFSPDPTAPSRPPRRAELVREVPLMPVSHLRLGDVITSCRRGCRPESVREGLFAAAGRFGATELVDVSCVSKGRGTLCSAIATAPEVDPELDPRAR